MIVVAAGVGISSGAFLLMLLKLRQHNFSLDIQGMKRKVKLPTKSYSWKLNSQEKIVGLGAGFLGAGLGTSLYGSLQLFVIAFIAGAFMFRYFENLRKEVIRNNRIKEIAVLFDAIELYISAGYTLFQALQAAKMLTPIIEPYVQRCLNRWPSGSRQALEQFKKDLAVPEGEMLTSLLIYMEAAGIKNLEGVLEQEAHNIERLRRMRIESSISKKPIVMMLYRFMPVAAVIGIVAGTLIYRLTLVIAETGIYKF